MKYIINANAYSIFSGCDRQQKTYFLGIDDDHKWFVRIVHPFIWVHCKDVTVLPHWIEWTCKGNHPKIALFISDE